MSGPRRWITALALLSLGLAASLGWRRGPGAQEATPFPQAAAQAPQRAASVQALAAQRQPSSVPAGPASGPLLASPPPDGLSARARRMREDWCGYGLREAQRDEEEREARRAGKPAGEEAEKAADADQVMDQAREQVLATWIARLRSRKDLRSQAIADYLAGDTPSRAHLQDLARRSTDPMVTVLALQRPCKSQACTAVDAAQWARLEPDNLMAWMAQAQTEQTPYLIERMGREAQRSEDYGVALGQALADLADASSPGLRQMAEESLLTSLLAAWNLPSFSAVLSSCQAARGQPVMTAHCEHIAQLMWNSPHLLGRALALALARRLVPATHPQRPEWERRALHFEALMQADIERSQAQLERWARMPVQEGCAAAALEHAALRQRLRLGEWALAQELQTASGESLEVLAARSRARRDGRSVLDGPAPASAAASAAR